MVDVIFPFMLWVIPLLLSQAIREEGGLARKTDPLRGHHAGDEPETPPTGRPPESGSRSRQGAGGPLDWGSALLLIEERKAEKGIKRMRKAKSGRDNERDMVVSVIARKRSRRSNPEP